jgi:hypothetical protein
MFMTKNIVRAIAGRSAVFMTAALVLAVGSSAALADASGPMKLDAVSLEEDATLNVPADMTLAQANMSSSSSAASSEEMAMPAIGFGLTYALYSDYIFRGVNFSEYPGEGKEELNHQLTVSLSADLGDFGSVGADAWFEWFAGQDQIDPEKGGHNLQEIDYVFWWGYGIEPISTDLTVGWTYYYFPNLAYSLRQDGDPGNNNDNHSQEFWFSLDHNDAWMWKSLWPDNEEGVLNPSFFMAWDIGSLLGTWMELSFSHDFDVPGVDNLTITPGYTVHADCNYWTEGAKLAGETLSLVAAYDLTPVLQLPEWAGSMSITGELYFFDAWGNMEDNGVIQDEFWGGMSLSWACGG